jgi:2-hydroxy-3-oxopropionate reductase
MTRAAGIKPEAVLASLTGGRADSALFQEFFLKFATVDLTPTGTIANMVKDLGTAAAAAPTTGLTQPQTELALAQNEELANQGHGQGDNANVMRLYGQIQ